MSDDINVVALSAGARPELVAVTAPRGDGGRIARLAAGIAWGALGIVIMLTIWRAFLWIFDIDPIIGRTPSDVWHALTTASGAADNRRILFDNSFTTLRDAALGLVAGTIAALIGAIVFTLRRGVQQTFMPISLVLQSVPLVALTPLIALIFGRGLLCVTVISGIVTFFPTLVTVTLALREVPAQSIDLVRAYGGTPAVTLRKVQFPSALPALFASLRIAAPRALVGGLLAEWLATGEGLGGLMLRSMTNFELDRLWAAVVLVTLYSVVLYTVISALEQSVLARYAPHQLGRRV